MLCVAAVAAVAVVTAVYSGEGAGRAHSLTYRRLDVLSPASTLHLRDREFDTALSWFISSSLIWCRQA